MELRNLSITEDISAEVKGRDGCSDGVNVRMRSYPSVDDGYSN
jgi:hypothetical protein